jgi:hypothetical protein
MNSISDFSCVAQATELLLLWDYTLGITVPVAPGFVGRTAEDAQCRAKTVKHVTIV